MLAWCQAIAYTNDGLLSIRPLGTIFFSEILIKTQYVSFREMHMKTYCLLKSVYFGLETNLLIISNNISESLTITI